MGGPVDRLTGATSTGPPVLTAAGSHPAKPFRQEAKRGPVDRHQRPNNDARAERGREASPTRQPRQTTSRPGRDDNPKKRDRREHQIDAGMMDAPGFEGGREKHGSGRQSTDSDRDPQKRSIIHRPALSANACAHVRASSRCSNESSKWTGGTGRIVLVAASASKRSGSSRPVESPKRVPGLRVGPAARTCSR